MRLRRNGSGSGSSVDGVRWGAKNSESSTAAGAVRARGEREGPLRALHSGRIGDYVAWTAVGAAAIASVFALTLA